MIANRTFTKTDPWFAQRAGDWNPIHIDEIAARRLVFGETVVHGIHICLWAINAAMRFEKPHNSLSHIKVRFESPLPVGVEVSLVSIEGNGQERRLLVRTDRTLVRISLTFNDKNQPIDNLSYEKNTCDFSPQRPKNFIR